MNSINSHGWSVKGKLIQMKFGDLEMGQKFHRLIPGYSREYTKSSDTTATLDMSFFEADIPAGEIVEAHFVAKK